MRYIQKTRYLYGLLFVCLFICLCVEDDLVFVHFNSIDRKIEKFFVCNRQANEGTMGRPSVRDNDVGERLSGLTEAINRNIVY